MLVRLKREKERADRVWEPIHEAILEERSFAEGQHYEDETSPHERGAAYLRFVGQETFNVIRHKSAQLTDTATLLEARPVDELSDPDDAEFAVSLLETETGNPQKGFEDCKDLMATAALAARLGAVWIDWDPDLGPWGELTFRPGDATKLMWQPGYNDPHDPHCDWVREERVFDRAELVRMLSGNKYANRAMLDALKGEAVNVNATTASGGQLAAVPSAETGDDIREDAVTVALWWLKNDRTTKTRERSDALLPEQRYMVCGAPDAPGCGWRSKTQRELGAELPEMGPEGSCPVCYGPTMRVDVMDTVESVLVYPKGKRLVWEVVDQKGLDEPVYDGPWPTFALNPSRDIRSFPLYVFTSYLPMDPTKPVGTSDTALNWSAQNASDYLMTKAFRAAANYQRYYSVPETGITDYKGRRFEFRPEQFNVMFRAANEATLYGPQGLAVNVLEGSQFDPSLPAYWQMVQQVLNAKQGIADLGLSPGQSKDIPATSIAQMNQMADLPMEHLKRRWHRALARGHGVLWDLICATYTTERVRRLRLGDGTDSVLGVRGDELANFDFVISDAPTFSGLEKAKAEALERLMMAPPEWQELFAEVYHLSPSILRKVQKRQQEMQAMGIGGGVPGQMGEAIETDQPSSAAGTTPPLDEMGSADPRRRVAEMAGVLGGMTRRMQ